MPRTGYTTDFTQGNVLKQLFAFATPLLVSSFLQIAYNLVDMIVVGHAVGKVGLSAVAIGSDVVNCLTFLAMGFSNAGQIIISQYLGAKRRDQIGKFLGTLCSFLALYAILATAVALYGRNDILRWMNTPLESYSETLAYSTICMLGMIFIAGYNAVSAVLRGLGDSKHPFVFISMAALLNVALDLLFVLGFHMGAGGAALATVISQGVSFVSCVIFMAAHRREFGLEIKLEYFRFDGDMTARLIRLGLPMAIKNAAVQFSKLFVNSWINSYGVAVSAFAGIVLKISSIANLVSSSFITAGSSMVGQNIAGKSYPRVKKILIYLAAVAFSIAVCMSLIFCSFPEQIYKAFTSDADVIAIGMRFLPIAVIIFFGSATRTPANALINGSGNYKVNFATAILDGIVLRIGLGLFFGLAVGMQHYGFWLGDALAGFTPGVIATVFYLSGSWKRAEALR